MYNQLEEFLLVFHGLSRNYDASDKALLPKDMETHEFERSVRITEVDDTKYMNIHITTPFNGYYSFRYDYDKSLDVFQFSEVTF